jgi:hypothetical protein
MCRPDEERGLIARGRLTPTKEGSGGCRAHCIHDSFFRGWAERPRVFAVAEPSVEKPEDRQSERSDVCRDRAKQR